MLLNKAAQLRHAHCRPSATPKLLTPAHVCKIRVVRESHHRISDLSVHKPLHVIAPKNIRSVKAASSASSDATTPAPVVQGTSTFVQAVFNVVNVMAGVGLLSLPFALKSSGWVGVGLLWLMGFVTNYTGKALVECAAAVVARRNLPAGTVVGYEEIAEETFGKLGRLLVSSIMYVELFGTCCLLYILEGDNMFNLLGTRLAGSGRAYMWIAAAIMIPTVWLPDLSALASLGAAGVTATCTVVASIAYTFLSRSFASGAVTHTALWSTVPLVLGIMTFCYSGHGVFPAIQASMKEPEQFPKVLDVAFLLVAALCTFVAVAGYFMYGTASADLVIFNLPTVLASVCSTLVLINPIAKFALTMEPVAAAATKAAGGAKGPVTGLPRLVVRTAVALAILFAARSLPFLAPVMAFVGALMTISVSVTLPAVCHQVLHKGKLSGAQVAWNWFVAALGVTGTILGTWSAAQSLAAKAAASAAGVVA